MADDHEHEPLPPGLPPVSRRGFMFYLGLGMNTIAASLVGIPIVGYVLSAVFKEKAQQAWVPLGRTEQFPEGQTRLATYTNPFTRPWDGFVADIPCWVRHISEDQFQIFAI